MIINLSKDMERIVHDAVRAGLYICEEDVIRDALTRLKETLPKYTKTRSRRAKFTCSQKKKPLTEAELQQHMLKIGLMTQLPDTDADFDNPADVPITIKGEPRSETIIRQAR